MRHSRAEKQVLHKASEAAIKQEGSTSEEASAAGIGQIKVRKHLQKREVPEAAVDLDIFRRCRVSTLLPTILLNFSMGVGLSESVGCP
jgi:hypothetical protein